MLDQQDETKGLFFMRKRCLCMILAIVLAVGTLGSVPARAAVEITAPSAVLIDAATGTVLFEQNAHERLAPASVTKVMTLLLVMEALDAGRIGWEDQVTTSAAAAAKGGSQIYLEENEQMGLRDMLKSVVVSSANDCATALAEHVAGSESAFVDLMNARAAELGMEDTHFVNCTGLDDEPSAAEHLTSAYDIALMSRELLKHDEIREYTTIWMDTVRNGQFGLSNTNKLVRFYQGTTGLKTGFTRAAGYCLSASAERDGLELIAVVLHCESSTDRFESAKALLDYGFANYCLVSSEPDEPLPAVPVVLGEKNEVQAVLSDATPILADKGAASNVEKTVEMADSVTAPVEAGQKLGTMVIRSNGQPLGQVDIVAAEAVEKLTWGQILVQLLRAVCLSG